MEGTFLFRISFVAIVLVIQMPPTYGCLEDERMGLLQLRALIKSYCNGSFDPLPSWVGSKHSDCCKWERVKCNAVGRVVDLSLGDLFGDLDIADCFLNVSLFKPFEELKSLNLSYNWFTGLANNRGSVCLKRLEILDLRSNRFDNSIMSTLSGLISLKTLILQYNGLEGSVPTQDLAKLKHLEILDLRGNRYYDGSIALQGLRSLRVLGLSHNEFNGTIPIEGIYPASEETHMTLFSGLCEAKNLVELDMSANYITGHLPWCLGNLTNLRALDISANQFYGEIPFTIANLTSLEYLSLADNYFEGLFMLRSLANNSKLKVFQLSGRDSSKLKVETEYSPWLSTFQLEVLILRNCNLNKQTTAKIPNFLSSQYDLRYIDLAHNKLDGTFPLWLLQNNSKLEILILTNNSFTGSLQLPDVKLNLVHLRISRNKLSGQLPMDMGLLLPKVKLIDLSKNSFEGNLPSSMNKMTGLFSVDLSDNKLSGEVPYFLFCDMTSLQYLLLGNNYFHGSIKDGRFNATMLHHLDISNNSISGRIPSWIGRSPDLRVLQMSKNILQGELPTELCNLRNLEFLDISQNHLSGHIPSCFHLSSLRYLYMGDNDIFGPIHHALSRSSELEALDLSYNKLSGEIPRWLNEITYLQVLLLKGNELQGPIPQQLCQLRKIRIVNLSNNKLNGSIPSCFNMSFGFEHVNPIGLGDVFEFGYSYDLLYNATLEFGFTEVYDISGGHVEAGFTTMSRFETYKGDFLNYGSELDLSRNELTGQIPWQIGDLQQIHVLDFSHNNLTGSIPKTISNLRSLERLDISCNSLSGELPWQLTLLQYLSSFNVSYNNFSGTIPTGGQFLTFTSSSFVGNPYLCGEFLENNCSSLPLPKSSNGEEMVAFCWSFFASYVTTLLSLAIVLWINPQWRRRWFHFITICCSYLRECVHTGH